LGGFKTEQSEFLGEIQVAVTLAGRVPVRISTENGPIEPGDPLTSSSTPGVAMKATHSGPVVAKALESFSCESATPCQGKIVAFVNVSYYFSPDDLQTLETATQTLSLSTDLTPKVKQSLENLGFFIENGVAKLKELTVDKVTALAGNFGKIVFGELAVKKGSQTAGQASFENNQTEVLITSGKVTEGSLIYITPTTKTDGLTLYIKEQKPGESFTVALERSSGDLPNQATASATQAIKFNWLIVNQQ
jgi:hypothetical protein